VREVRGRLSLSARLRFRFTGRSRWIQSRLDVVIFVFVQSFAGRFLDRRCKNENWELHTTVSGVVGIGSAVLHYYLYDSC